jgi:hypothetical protein
MSLTSNMLDVLDIVILSVLYAQGGKLVYLGSIFGGVLAISWFPVHVLRIFIFGCTVFFRLAKTVDDPSGLPLFIAVSTRVSVRRRITGRWSGRVRRPWKQRRFRCTLPIWWNESTSVLFIFCFSIVFLKKIHRGDCIEFGEYVYARGSRQG